MTVRTLCIVAALVLTATAAAGMSPEKRFEKLIRKYAIPQSEVTSPKAKPRVACACQSPSTSFPGFLILGDDGLLYCAASIDFVNGLIESYAPCPDFEVLSR